MDPLLWLIVLLLVALGLFAAALARGTGRDEQLVSRFGFRASRARSFHGEWGGRRVALTVGRDGLALESALTAQPVPYDKLARASGRGDLLAELHAFAATAGHDTLVGRLDARPRARTLKLGLDAFTALAHRLEALAGPEALARWYLELGDGEDPIEALRVVLDTFPDAPETRAICAHELETRRHPGLVTLCREHLARPAPPALGDVAGRH